MFKYGILPAMFMAVGCVVNQPVRKYVSSTLPDRLIHVITGWFKK